jgi:MYXO-CTERM domain-containing protein
VTTLLAHATSHGGTESFAGVALLLLGAAAALWHTRRRNR